MSDLPAPLVPAEVDLRDFGFLPLDAVRLRDSNLALLASGDGFRAAVLLWCVAWHQSPAASLPDDDRLLASYVGYGRDLEGWQRIRAEALRGFVLCSDGRFYHPLLAEKAHEAWASKIARKARTAAATAARQARQDVEAPQGTAPGNSRKTVRGDVGRDVQRNGPRDVDRGDPRSVHQGTGKGQGQGEGYNPPEPPSGSPLPKGADRARGTRIAADWALDDAGRFYALGQGLAPADVEAEVGKFRDYWSAKAGADARKVDWAATWRTWARTAVERRNRPIAVQSGFGGRPGAPDGAGAARSTSGPSSARAGIAAALNSYRGEPL